MQVNTQNFNLVADEIVSLIRTCEFYAMDQEMTGINAEDVGPNCVVQSPPEGYPARRAAAIRYNAFQIGFCLFHRVDDGINTGEPRFIARPFNMWLRQRGHHATDIRINWNAVDFLLSNSMDFQYLFKNGIPYCDRATEAKERQWFFPTEAPDLSDVENLWVRSQIEKIEEWLAAPESPPDFSDKMQSISQESDLALWFQIRARGWNLKVEPPLHTRFSIYRRTSTTYTRLTEDEMKSFEQQDLRRREILFDSVIGFSKIFTALLSCKSTAMIGHNFSSDLMFYLNQHHSEIPEDYEAFKALTHSLFPRIFDTKTLASRLPKDPMPNTSLGPLYADLERRNPGAVNASFPLGFEAYHPDAIKKGSGGAHQGGYDAFMTGIVYLHFVRLHGQVAVDELMNQISVFGSVYLMNLSGADLYAHDVVLRVFDSARSRQTIEAALLTDIEKAEKEKPRRPGTCARPSFSLIAGETEKSTLVFTSRRESTGLVRLRDEMKPGGLLEGLEVTDLNEWRTDRVERETRKHRTE